MRSSANDSYLEWQGAGQSGQLLLRGSWLLANHGDLVRQVAAFRKQHQLSSFDPSRIDASGLKAIDTVGAMQLLGLLGADVVKRWLAIDTQDNAARKALLETILQAEADAAQGGDAAKPVSTAQQVLGEIGEAVEGIGKQIVSLLGAIGLTLQVFFLCLFSPKRWRPTSVVAQLDVAGFRAVPIVALLTFMVGAVVAFLGATILANFGATIYTVDLVGFSFLREFAVLLAAILVAGRTASAYAAQLGLMKVNEEIDALRMTGLDPVEVLMIPRVAALLVALPLLTFVGMISGILGGMVVSAVALDISPNMFVTILQRDVAVKHFVLGMAKAPIFAFLIAVIGCSEGFKVSGSAQSVGTRTTSAVVQSIFVVILLDAVAALFYMEMGW
ncbi:ABC transporter permease [Pusillimonas sp. CC-YST705]|uniref:ABC transporter permease n=1 Tax=Mesopusillimonas faecipullorum TaxID=2755040 RepID=A0ABS8C8C9_9BURK|nr:ABC transporter permease [Mesopusillimonas faecipullorum]MCB5362277.1 ABC transporter permease [Mesopusillimonas faecipullorum]